MKRRRKTVIAGNLVKIVESTPPMPRDTRQIRNEKHKTTSAAQKALNHKNAQGRLEEKLAANFSSRDYFITYTYRPGAEPATRREAKEDRARYIRKLREIRHRRGQPLFWIIAIENKHDAGRYHFHAIINAVGYEQDAEEIQSLWMHGNVKLSRLFDPYHDCGEDLNTWLSVAKYLTKERPEDGPDVTPNGAQLYSCSRNLKKPIVISEWVEDADRVEIPSTACGVEYSESHTEYSTFRYYKYMIVPLKGAK